MQTAREYLHIINEAVQREFGCLFPMGKSYVKSLCFSFTEEYVPEDVKKHLVDKAVRNMNNGLALPRGIYLTECQIKTQ